MHLTHKQIELMRVIVAGIGENDPADLDEILERVRYATTKQSLQFSIRALIAHGLIEKRGIEKRRGRQRQVIAATRLGRGIWGPQLVMHDRITLSNGQPEKDAGDIAVTSGQGR